MKSPMTVLFFFASLAHVLPATASASQPESNEYCKVDFFSGSDVGVYKGQCVEDIPFGSGVVEFYNGDMMEGKFKNGQLEGEAIMKAANGNTYNGEVVNGKRHGNGTFTWARGSNYVGEWVDDKRHGNGTFTWANGNRFEGEFRDNKRYNGMYYTSNGRVMKCRMGQCR